jgi:uncharacterized OsmC-like protein
VFPTNHAQGCVWVCTPTAHAKAIHRHSRSRPEAFDQLLARAAPALAGRLRQARRVSPVGDAGYHRDAVSGYGISDAFRDAELLAVALDQALRGQVAEALALAGYQRQRDQALRDIFELTCQLAAYPRWLCLWRCKSSSAQRSFVFDADHPAVLVDHGPTPVEFVLHALTACLTAGLANIAAARRVRLTQVRSTITGDIDLNGILGLDPSVRNGYQGIAVRFTIKGDAPAHKLRELVAQSRARSAVYDIITNQVPVTIQVDPP